MECTHPTTHLAVCLTCGEPAVFTGEEIRDPTPEQLAIADEALRTWRPQ